jgi:hypothetical protein
LHAYPQLPEVDAEGRESDPRMVDDELRQAEKALVERAAELEDRLDSRPRVRLVVGEAAAYLLEAAEEQVPSRTFPAVVARPGGRRAVRMRRHHDLLDRPFPDSSRAPGSSILSPRR